MAAFSAGFENKTLRQCIFTSVGGEALRIRISNRYGKQPLRIAKAAFGVKRKGLIDDAEVIARTVVPITFAGSRAVTIPAGHEIASDPAVAQVLPHQTLAIDLYFHDATGTPEINFHPGLAFLADGDRAGSAAPTGFSGAENKSDFSMGYYLRGVDVRNAQVTGVIVCGADSLSHGAPVREGYVDWPQILSRRLRAAYGDRAPSVVQSTMMGNRLLLDAPLLGPTVLARFESDMLAQPGITKLILFAGFNDLAIPNFPHQDWTGPQTMSSFEQFITAYTALIDKAHARGIPIYGCTITPGSGARAPLNDGNAWSTASETMRQKLNDWFRSSGRKLFDGVFDFARATENPLDREFYDPACSADQAHPSAGGQYALAHAIDLETLMR